MERMNKLHQNWLIIRLPQNMHYWLMKQPPHQVRNILLHPPKYLKSKKYLEGAKMLHQNWLLIRIPQNMHYWLMKQPPHQVMNMFLHSPKYLKSKKYLERQKAAPKLVVNQNTTKQLLTDETATTSGMLLHPQKFLNYLERQKSCTKTGY